MSTVEDKTPIFSKARVSNITAAVVVFAVIWGFIAGIPETVNEGGMMAALAGFAAKHLFDTSQS